MAPTPVCVRRRKLGPAPGATPELRRRPHTLTHRCPRRGLLGAGTPTWPLQTRRPHRPVPTGTATEARGTPGCPRMRRRARRARCGRSAGWKAVMRPRRASLTSCLLSRPTTSGGQTRRRWSRPSAPRSLWSEHRWVRARTRSPWTACNAPKRARPHCRRLTPPCMPLRQQALSPRRSGCARPLLHSRRTGRRATTQTRRRPCAVHRVVAGQPFRAQRTRAGTTSTWEEASSPRLTVSCWSPIFS